MGQLVDETTNSVSPRSKDTETIRDKNTDILLQAWREVQLARAQERSKKKPAAKPPAPAVVPGS